MTEDEMVGWHHQLNGREFEQALADSEGQGTPLGLQRAGHDWVTEQQICNSRHKHQVCFI